MAADGADGTVATIGSRNDRGRHQVAGGGRRIGAGRDQRVRTAERRRMITVAVIRSGRVEANVAARRSPELSRC